MQIMREARDPVLNGLTDFSQQIWFVFMKELGSRTTDIFMLVLLIVC